MYVRTDSLEAEMRLAVEAVVELTNAGTDPDAIRGVLVARRYTGAAEASPADLEAVAVAFAPVARLARSLPDTDLGTAVAGCNELLAAREVRPSIQTHDGTPIHIHWTERSAPFADQVVTDMVMALAHTLCDTGVDRFGTCGATDCAHLFFDTTRNHSRRFCTDPKCASRTHTAEHRARQRARRNASQKTV
jgi:predicted RNA-binding Zn ribbon-like protein